MQSLNESERFLDTPQLADRWKCKEATVGRNWQKWGLKSIRFGKKRLFSLESVEAVERRKLSAAE